MTVPLELSSNAYLNIPCLGRYATLAGRKFGLVERQR